jgi:hypothetical protein
MVVSVLQGTHSLIEIDPLVGVESSGERKEQGRQIITNRVCAVKYPWAHLTADDLSLQLEEYDAREQRDVQTRQHHDKVGVALDAPHYLVQYPGLQN